MPTPLFKAREKRKLTLTQASALVGCDKGHYSRIENGRAKPSAKLAAKIAGFFGPPMTEEQIVYPERFTAPVQEIA